MIEIYKLKKTYPGFKLIIDELKIMKNEIVGIVGNNGAGKTTFLSLLLDLLQPTSGTVFINGKINSQNEEWKKVTGAFLDESFLINYLTPEEYFSFIARVYKISDDILKNNLLNFKKFFNNEILNKNKLIKYFSSGNRQKIGIIGALLHNPNIIIFDEPISNLDPRSRKEFEEIIKKHADNNIIILSSHDLNLIEGLCSRILILDQGQIKKDIIEKEALSNIIDNF